MPGTNDFKGFALAATDTYTPAEWAALTALLANGFSTGVASTKQVNTLMRQVTSMTAALGKIISDAELNAVDDGNVTNLAQRLTQALSTLFPSLASVAETQAGTSNTKAVSPAGLAASVLGGVGQSWQDVTGSRSFGTTYTNTTGRTIALSLRTSPVNSSFVNLTVGGVLIARRWGGETWAPEIPIFGIVPSGATYVVSGSNALQSWCELR